MRLLLILSLVLAACAGRGGAPAQDAQDQQNTSAGGQATAAAQGGDAAPASELTKKRQSATFKVEYKWTSGKDAPLIETWYQKPPRSRVDHGDADQKQQVSQFALPTGTFYCETSSGAPSCIKAPANVAAVEQLSFIGVVMTAYEGLLTDPAFKSTRETRTIAGQQGSCIRSGNVLALGFAEVTMCYTGNGVPLLFQWKVGADMFTMEATSYSSSVSDKDLELPAAPQN